MRFPRACSIHVGVSIFFLALALQAQESAPLGKSCDPHCPPPPASCDATDWKARAEWLEQKIAATEAVKDKALQYAAAKDQLQTAVDDFKKALEQLTGLAAKEPPKPKGETK